MRWSGCREHPDQRERLSRERDTLLDSATEEFLRFFTPAPGDGRTIAADCEVDGIPLKEGERLWLSWAMANRDPEVFDRSRRDHPRPQRATGTSVSGWACTAASAPTSPASSSSRCSPRCSTGCPTSAATRQAPCTTRPSASSRACSTCLPPSPRAADSGPGLDATLEKLQRICDEQGLAAPITEHKAAAVIDG